MSADELWKIVESACEEICLACNEGKHEPLLEADVVAYFYHILIAFFSGSSRRLHLDTRVYGADQKEKYDLVIGDVVGSKEQKQAILARLEEEKYEHTNEFRKVLKSDSALQGFRPAVKADAILEFKIFAQGFSPQQQRVHLDMVLDDVKKLSAIRNICPSGRGIVVFDDASYATKPRLDKILASKGSQDSTLRIYLIQRRNGEMLRWVHF